MQQKPTGNQDEFFYLAISKKVRFDSQMRSSEKSNEFGKPFGFYQMSTKGKGKRFYSFLIILIHFFESGIAYFDGGVSPRDTHRWNHVCVSVNYTDLGAERTIFVDGKLHFKTTTAFLQSTIWPQGRTFAFGGSEPNMRYDGFALDGYMADIQVFSKVLSEEDMIGYTLCQKVNLIHSNFPFNRKSV